MPIRKVILDRDARSPFDLSLRALVKRHRLRRTVSILALLLMDGVSLVVAVLVAHALLPQSVVQTPKSVDVTAVITGAFVTLGVFAASGLYGKRSSRHSAGRIVRAAVISLVLVVLGATVMGFDVPRQGLATAWAIALACTLTARQAYDWALGRVFTASDETPVLLVGGPAECARMVDLLAKPEAGHDYRVIGIVCEEPPCLDPSVGPAPPTLGSIADLEAVVVEAKPAEIVVADSHTSKEHMPALIEICHRHRVTLKLAALENAFGPDSVEYVPGLDLPLFVLKPPALAGADFYLKRGGDLVTGAVLTLVLSPVLALLALAVRLESKGPALFVDDRIGLNQNRFRCYKFRTMSADAPELQAELEHLNEADGAIFKIKEDPRLTRVGKLLRRTSLDELPQLFNVLKGEMSLVGPRPLPLRDFRRLDDLHKQRHVVLPGMTGLWQVSGRSDLSFEEMIALDLRYIETWSISRDLSILIRTVGAVFGFHGAY